MTKYAVLLLTVLLLATACRREPELHLYGSQPTEMTIIFAEIELDVYWDYVLETGVKYDWHAEWYYGWNDEDRRIFGEIGYTMPNVFNIRRYFTGNTPYGHHTKVLSNTIEGNVFRGEFSFGYWDMLAYNDVKLIDGVQSINFDETTTLDSISVHTNPSMNAARYHAPRFTHSFYEPEELFSAYEQAIDINRDYEGFVYDPEQGAYIKKVNMVLQPITYIYLTQVIVHHNKGKISGVDGLANLSGVARSSVLNSGRAGEDAITVSFKTHWKNNCDMNGEKVDIAGGRLLTFGICGQNSSRLHSTKEVRDNERHYFDLKMQFNNGLDSTFVFDVTDQVRQRYKGGVLTVELDMDTVPIPSRSGGSAFNAVVEEYKEETHEFGL
jgi:hypothetical protein